MVEGNGPRLVGRDWLGKICLNWKSLGIGIVSCVGVSSVHSVLQKFENVFE